MNPKLSFLSQFLIGNARSGRTRSYNSKAPNRTSLYHMISPIGGPGKSVLPVLNDWVEKKYKVRLPEVQKIIHDLRRRRRFTHALEVSEWMKKINICVFSPTEHAVQLDLIGKVRGFAMAESYFDSLMTMDKTAKTYGALLNCYARQKLADKFFQHLQKMKDLGFASSALTYNNVMSLYTNMGQYEKVPGVLVEMKENNISPDRFSYFSCVNSYGMRSDFDGMEKIIEKMERQTHITVGWNTYSVAANHYIKAGLNEKAIAALKKTEEKLINNDGSGYNFLFSQYATLGKKDEVVRLWNRLKRECKRCLNKEYIAVLESLARLGEFEKAGNILEEWYLSGNSYDCRAPNSLVIGYAEKGDCEKAEAMLDNMVERGKATNSKGWAFVAGKYLEKEETERALECMKMALSLRVGKSWKPDYSVICQLLESLGDKGSVEDVEDFVKSLRKVVKVNKHMFFALLKAYVRAGKDTKDLLEQMKKDNINDDEKTQNILAMSNS